MNNASIDVDARRTFREELRGKRVALRSFIPRDDIDDVEIVEAEDPEVSATRQVLKVELADASAVSAVERVERVERTGEIDALDVLESIDIVQECAPHEVKVPSASVTDAFAIGVAVPARAPLAPPIAIIAIGETAPMPAMTASSAPSVLEERAPYAALDVEDDAFFAHSDSPSTGPVTFHLGDSYVDEVGPTIELHGTSPNERRRRLGWIVATVIACAAVMTAAAAITEQTQSASNESPAFTAQAPRAAAAAATTNAAGPTVALTPAVASTSRTISPATTTAYPAIPEMDVRSLPAALAGTIVGVPKRPLFVDGKRLQSSTAIVACGKHTVKTGAFRAAHVIDVPCGGSITLK
ncbi:MAG: hypothetical protein JWO86_2810 [Myxococcaceae bacterium]|nr:hypothetical protein [Myxococcaceae bacterium]